MDELVHYHLQRAGSLRTDRSNFDNQWEEAARLLIPAHVGTFFGRGNDQPQGAKNTEQQYDSTAAIAALRFSAVMESLCTPQNAVWHRLVPMDKTLRRNRKVRIFFDDVTELLFKYRYRPIANFVSNIQQVYHALGTYGNGTLFIDQPDGEKGLRYRNIHIAEVYYAENHAGIVDTCYRFMKLTARQAMQKFGMLLPDAIKNAAANPQMADTTKYDFWHIVCPNPERNPERADAAGMPYQSLYVSVEGKLLLRKGGFRSFPFPSARYTQASGETYGRGPAQWVLPAIKVLNEEKKTVLKQGHRIVDPVLLAHDDGVVDTFSLRAGALNRGGVSADGRLLVQPLPVGNIAVGEKMMEMERQVINDAFLMSLFQILVDSPQMTATEVLERAREKGMLVAPTAGRQQAEFLGPMIERELDLLANQGLLPPVPPILAEAGGEYKIEYDSPMARMQRAEKASGFMRALSTATEYAKATMDPTPLDWFNFDVAMPEVLDIHGAPTEWTRTMDEVIAVREQRAEQQQQQQMLEAAPALTGIMKAAPEMMKGQQ